MGKPARGFLIYLFNIYIHVYYTHIYNNNISSLVSSPPRVSISTRFSSTLSRTVTSSPQPPKTVSSTLLCRKTELRRRRRRRRHRREIEFNSFNNQLPRQNRTTLVCTSIYRIIIYTFADPAQNTSKCT